MFRRKLKEFAAIFYLIGSGSSAVHFRRPGPIQHGPDPQTLAPYTLPISVYYIQYSIILLSKTETYATGTHDSKKKRLTRVDFRQLQFTS
jgi:hypothetical protein